MYPNVLFTSLYRHSVCLTRPSTTLNYLSIIPQFGVLGGNLAGQTLVTLMTFFSLQVF